MTDPVSNGIVPEEIVSFIGWAFDDDALFRLWNMPNSFFENKTPMEMWSEDKKRVINFFATLPRGDIMNL